MSQQKEAAKERGERLTERQRAISRSLEALRDDLNDEIEDALTGVKRGGETLDRALRQMRSAWEGEVSELINEAEMEIEDAMREIEEGLQAQREEWARSIRTFDEQWLNQGRLSQGLAGGGDTRRTNATRFNTTLLLLSKPELSTRLSELQASLDSISADIEDDLTLFKRRWDATTRKVGASRQPPRCRPRALPLDCRSAAKRLIAPDCARWAVKRLIAADCASRPNDGQSSG